jgi:hypothetical protein
MLLREVLARNPFKNRAAWKEIATELSTLNFPVEPRRVKEIYIDKYFSYVQNFTLTTG